MPRKKKAVRRGSKAYTPALILVASALVAVLAFMVVDQGLRDMQGQLSFSFFTRSETREQRLTRMLTQVKRHVTIPPDASPFAADVQNVEFLRKQYAFYGPAKDGDVLVLTTTRAILYRPETDVIVDMLSRIEANSTRPGVSAPAVVPKPATVVKRSSSSSVWRLEQVQ